MQLLLKRNPLFNPAGDDRPESRCLTGGNVTNLMNLNSVRFDWAVGLYAQMRENFWIPQKINITQDVTDYANLTPEERRAYDGILSYLTFLDSIQTRNLPNIQGYISAPEIALCLTEQASQEGMHNQSYQVLIESIIPANRREEVYDFWRSDRVLLERCKYIAAMYQKFSDNPNPESFFEVLVADYLLEGLYFYNGFISFYNLASRMLMSGSADMFKQINRDELSHVRLFQRIIPEAMQLLPHSTERIYEMFATAVEQEIEWTNHIVGTQILGITDASTEVYTKYLANSRLRAIGLESLYKGDAYKRSPYAHLERFSDTKGDGATKANFFESGVTAYSMSSALSGWDDI
jgi:ribonucleoside-diphosphate reductase beta chain